jgi:hypothetical protein
MVRNFRAIPKATVLVALPGSKSSEPSRAPDLRIEEVLVDNPLDSQVKDNLLDQNMELRDHPLMRFRGAPNWPPVWIWIGGGTEVPRQIHGEVGVLIDLMWPHAEPRNRFHMIMQHDSTQYMGTLLFNDPSFCHEIFQLFQGHCRQPIERLGSLEISHLL